MTFSRAIGAALLAAAALTLASCDECQLGDGHCDGNHLKVCETGNDNQPVTYDEGGCDPGQCVETTASDQPVAACSTTGQPDARCAGADAANELCGDAQTVLHCRYGYAVEEPCAVACIDGSDLAFCALGSAPDARCTAASACAGSDLLGCLEGYLVSQAPCGALDPACVAGGGESYCATSANADPRCAGSGYWCDGSTAYACDAEGRSIAQACSDTASCTDWLTDESVLHDQGYGDLIATCG